ncbi:hypothetical protein Tco_1019838 [Tanacetum coccineum]|uniref:Uncharacterized protein n=1 Tax=Tanacetum coccineum TaxID=301880 RepID=A0ABQ5FZL3_9ASTR
MGGSSGERLFSKTYSYVDRISHLSEKPVQDLLKLHPAPPPRDAPKAGSGGIVFAPKLVKAAEVARSKDTTSLQDPASQHASEGVPMLLLKEDFSFCYCNYWYYFVQLFVTLNERPLFGPDII